MFLGNQTVSKNVLITKLFAGLVPVHNFESNNS